MKYYLPFVYFFSSRAKTILHKCSFVILLIVPIFIFWLDSDKYYKIPDLIWIFVLGFIGMFSIYEIGYLFNDVYTTKFELHPSYWLVAKDRNFVERYLEPLIAIRIIYSFICSIILKYCFNVNILYYCTSLVLLFSMYSLHNTIRNRWNILTDFFLQVLKYCSVLLLVPDFCFPFQECFLMILAVPVLRTIEFTNKKRLHLNIIKSVNKVRILYHAIVFILAIICMTFYIEFKYLAITSFILLIYRILCLILSFNKKIEKLRLKNFEDVQ